jgi:plastocyanin
MSFPAAGPLEPRRLATTSFVVAAIALAGCGGSSSSGNSSASAPADPSTPASSSGASAPAPASPSGTAASGRTLALEANHEGQLMFSTNSLSAKAGRVTIDFTNASPLEHNLTVASASGAVLGAMPTFRGGSKTLTLNLEPGVYKFYCSVPGHRQAGMEGTLTVS